MDLQKVLDKKKMKPRNTEEEEGLPIFYLLRVLLFSYLITGFLLLLLAFLLYRVGLSEKVVTISIIGIYVIATFLAGFLAGKKMEKHADLFIVQWETQVKHYKKAVYGGCLY